MSSQGVGTGSAVRALVLCWIRIQHKTQLLCGTLKVLSTSQEAFSCLLVLMKKLPRAAPESPVWLLGDERGMNGAEAGLAALGAGTQLKPW